MNPSLVFFSISGGVNALTSLFICCLVLFYGYRNRVNRLFSIFAFFVFLWSVAYIFWPVAETKEIFLFWTRALHVGAVFIPVACFHFTSAFLGLKRRKIVIIGYILAGLFCCFLFSPLFIVDARSILFLPYYAVPGFLYPFFLLLFAIYVLWSMYLMITNYANLSHVKKSQLMFVGIGMAIGFLGGSTNYFLFFNIPIPPYGNILVSFYVILAAYAIIKYRLMDIRVVVASTAIFLFVYAVALGIPFYFYYQNQYFFALILMAVLATIGPSIYHFLQRRANEAILKEQRQYQKTLIQASSGMGRIKDVKELLDMTVRIVAHVVRVEHAAVYVFDKSSQKYVLGGSLFNKNDFVIPGALSVNAAVIQQLGRDRKIVIFEEEQQKFEAGRKEENAGLCADISSLHAALVIPSLMNECLEGFLVLGPKISGERFSEDDLSVFTILANQLAMAIENALYYEDAKHTQEKLFEAEKMVTLGHLAGGLSHQLGNKLTHINIHLLNGLAKVDALGDAFFSKELCDEISDSLKKSKAGLDKTNDFVKNLLNFATNRESKEAIDLEKLVDATLGFKDLKNYKIEVQFEKRFEPDTPKAHANFVQLQEALLNIIDNAVYSMQEKSTAGVDPAYQSRIIFTGAQKGDRVALTIEDNGMGIKPEDQRKLFKPHFSTKKETGAGHGFGVYFVREVVENRNGGTVQYSSEYGQGVKIEVELPGYNE